MLPKMDGLEVCPQSVKQAMSQLSWWLRILEIDKVLGLELGPMTMLKTFKPWVNRACGSYVVNNWLSGSREEKKQLTEIVGSLSIHESAYVVSKKRTKKLN